MIILISLEITYSQNTINRKNKIIINYIEQNGCLDRILGKITINITSNKFIITNTTYSVTYSDTENTFSVYRGSNSKLVYRLLSELKTNSNKHKFEKRITNHFVNFTIITDTKKEKFTYKVFDWNGIKIFLENLKVYRYDKKNN